MSLNIKEDLLKGNLIKYFNNIENKKILINILNNSYNISLRIIDWFVTNYCKKYNIYWENNNIRFVVYLNYKLQLKAYSKKNFDPFCRRERIYFHYDDLNNYLITTIGQLNFIKWMIDNNIMNYIMNNYEKIEKDMQNTIKKKENIKQYINNEKICNTKKKNLKKRAELSKSATSTVTKNKINIMLKFE